MATASRSNAMLPPAISRSNASSPARQKFPSDQLRPYMKTLLNKLMVGASWDSGDKPRMSAYSKELADRIKQRMIEIQPQGFKYIVTATVSENLGQAGRADISCHWEDTDAAVQEMWSNDSIIVVVVAYAVRVI